MKCNIVIILIASFCAGFVFAKEADFEIRGIVIDANTGEPISGARVSDADEYAGGKYFTLTDANGNYSYETFYEEHNIKCEARGYESETASFETKLFGKKKGKMINFKLEPRPEVIVKDSNDIVGKMLSLVQQIASRTIELQQMKIKKAPQADIDRAEEDINVMKVELKKLGSELSSNMEATSSLMADKILTRLKELSDKYGVPLSEELSQRFKEAIERILQAMDVNDVNEI